MENTAPYAEVIVDLSTRRTDRVFHYGIPPEFAGKLTVGSMVTVPFGGRRLPGYVTGFGYPEKAVKIKEIAGILDQGPLFTPELLELARWMADNYVSSTAEALGCILAPRLRIKASRRVKVFFPALAGDKAGGDTASPDLSPKQLRVLREAASSPGLVKKELAAAAGVSVKTVDFLVKKGLLTAAVQDCRRIPGQPAGTCFSGSCAHRPSLEQKEASGQISAALARGEFAAFLLYGITGSGKTEVYLQAINSALETGRQAVALVPEISLTPQMVELFRQRFGGKVAVLHSALSGGERYDEWTRVKEGRAPVVLGTRSAVFAPLPRPGIFIIDEEHEPSYKQDDHLRYHAREVAIKRAQQSGAAVVLGSATPSLESWFKAVNGLYGLIKLSRRIDEKPLPRVHIIDLRQEIKKGAGGIFSSSLVNAVGECLKKREQVLLFLNRRGYTTFMVCKECGLALKCPRCEISLTYHLGGRLRCHYCNYSIPSPATCPGCGGMHMRHFGAGTQKVEEEAGALFPGARIVRMDSDSTVRKGSHERIISAFRERRADILIGTQMIAKGLDLPGVTLVGVINADITLHMPDFRSAERTFQLITQVAGRAGRGDMPGEVMVQTYCPEHYSIISAAEHDSESFYASELALRRSLGYPPFSHLARLLLTHEREEEAIKGARLARELIGGALACAGVRADVLGPAPAPLSKIKGKYRWQLVLRGRSRNALKDIIRECLAGLERNPSFKPAVNVDINPQGMM